MTATVANTKCTECGHGHITAVPDGTEVGDKLDGMGCLSVGECGCTERVVVNFIS